ncbi:low molecular weight protein-tyrosine-phosphatase [Limosilactobacillus fastidiosus]|uniref:protein-tyrosine-phosphatase n=1 Tax=Limosilactobacillus fastidiosus TaxID=2759855 RepID=A0A7W3U0U9_9LACO|nr:low molecular weight protein-tyrosine-phosphatase [Limosilactobacillus fastidiosus]MBB1062214.1 low molecular weight phosphotyrosine protein phosphatase [Limosilactobacillus fastidiosus]MBB1086585.1 low molecular weight phosphotyrosine protein phosphatase [Limosilactobacillus fastidiosus]MCD7084414.1 low molecular weight phosphotyrosine protein phosphatase [Limosilactobacillus fastidiosus]MCD7086561.1 low molecular weight phosphotyrosine protein phosphatase [Limosilactobacillus fastidiosus]
MKILFVCLGNICRSPMAEAMFRQMVEEKNLGNQIEIDSAATSNEEEGNSPHPGAQKIMRHHHLDPAGLISRPITKNDFDSADYIICMDDMNKRNLLQMAPVNDRHKIYQVYDIVPGKVGTIIPDPWYTHRFEDTYQNLAEALPYWLTKLSNEVRA